MIDWTKGLNSTQRQLLKTSFEEESKIPILEHTFTHRGNEKDKVLTDRLLPKNSLVPDRDSGYTYYIDTAEGLVRLSAFSWTIK